MKKKETLESQPNKVQGMGGGGARPIFLSHLHGTVRLRLAMTTSARSSSSSRELLNRCSEATDRSTARLFFSGFLQNRRKECKLSAAHDYNAL